MMETPQHTRDHHQTPLHTKTRWPLLAVCLLELAFLLSNQPLLSPRSLSTFAPNTIVLSSLPTLHPPNLDAVLQQHQSASLMLQVLWMTTTSTFSTGAPGTKLLLALSVTCMSGQQKQVRLAVS